MRIGKQKLLTIIELYYEYGITLEQLSVVTGMSISSLTKMMNSNDAVLYRLSHNLPMDFDA